MRRGRPISRGAGLGLLLLPAQYTAALRPSARPAIPSVEAYRSFPSGRGSRDSHGGGGSSSSRRCGGVGVALDSAEHAGQAAMFPAQQQAQPGDRREGSPASGAPALGNEDERRSNGGGEGSVDPRDHHHHHHPGPVDLSGGAAAPINGHHAVAAATAAATAAAAAAASSSPSTSSMKQHPAIPPTPPEPVPPLSARAADAVAAMKALGKDGRWREALAVLAQLKAAAAAGVEGEGWGEGVGDDLAPNVTVYNAAISAVSRSGKWDEALGLLEEMRSAGVQPDVMTFTSVISAGSRSGNVALAEQILDTMQAEGVPPNAATYNAVITGCSSAPPTAANGDGDGGGGGSHRALRLLERMAADPRPEAQPEALSYTLAIKACGREGRWEVALRLLAEMQAKGLKPTVVSFRYALAACSGGMSGMSHGGMVSEKDRSGAWERCRSLMDSMGRRGLEPDRLCYKYAVDAAAKAGDVDAALDLMDGMEACEGFTSASEYNQIIVACGHTGDWQRAVSTLGRIRRSGAAPDAHSFAMAMTACARSGEPRQALRLLDELKREGGDVRPNTVVYNILLGLCKGRPLRGGGGGGGGGRVGGPGAGAAVPAAAADTSENLNGYGGGSVVGKVNGHRGSVAAGLPGSRAVQISDSTASAGAAARGRRAAGGGAGANQWGEKPEELVGTAVTLLHEMTVGGGECAPDKMSFELVMQACVNAGRPESALKVFRAMTRWAKEGGSSSSSSSGGVQRRGGGGRRRGVSVRPDRATYRLGLTAAAEAGDGAAAAVLLEEMLDAGVALDESAYRLAATAFGRSGLWRQGTRLAAMAAEAGTPLSPSTLTSVLLACAKRSRWREALDLLQDARPALRQALSPPPPPPDGATGRAPEVGGKGKGSVVAAYTLAMSACRRADRHADGLQVLSMLEEDGGQGDEEFFRVALKCCAKAVGRSGSEDGSGSSGSSGAAAADRVLEDMYAQGIRCRVEGFTDVAQAYGLAGRWEDALSLLPRAAAVADLEEGDEARGAFLPDERMYCSVINAMGESGAWKQAVELVQSMRRRSSSTSSPQVLAGGDGNTDHKNERVAAASALETPTPTPRPGQAAYACACRACARQGEWGAVEGLMESMREDGVPRDVAVYASAMRAFVEAGKWERAVEIVTAEMELDGVAPDAISYNQALRACRAGADGGGRAAQLALELVAEVRSKGLGPDVVTLEGAARACLADGRPELGLDLVSEALESWRQGSLGRGDRRERQGQGEGAARWPKDTDSGDMEERRRWSPEEVQRLETMRILLLGRMGRWEESLQVLDAMRAKFGDNLDARAFVSAAHACAAAGEWALVQVIQSEASVAAGESGAIISRGVAWDMQRALLSGLASAGAWKRAMAVLRDMHSHRGGGEEVEGGVGAVLPGEEGRALGSGTAGGTRAMADSSVHWQRRMLKDYRTVMHACLRAGAWEEALSVWSDLRKQPGGPRPCVRTYATALRACGALGLWATARELLSEMRAAGGDLSPQARHYAFAVSAAAVADDRTLDEETAFSGRGWGDDRADTLAGGAEGGVGGDTALRFVLSEMVAGGAKLGWQAYAAVCWARSQRKHWHRASLGVLELIREGGLEGDASSPAVDHQQRAEGMRGLYGRLLAAAGKIPGRESNPGRGAAAQAVGQVLADAEERLASLPGGPGPHVIATAGVAFARAGDWESARDVALRLSCDARGGENGTLDFDDTRSGTIESHVGREQPAASRASVDDAASTAASAAAAGAAVTACSRAGELEEAEALTERLGFGHESGLALAAAYERAGRFSDAEALRSRLQGRMATSLGLGEAGSVVDEGDRTREGGEEEREGTAAGAAVPSRLPNVGGVRDPVMISVLDDQEDGAGLDRNAARSADNQYDLFLQWMATGEEEEEHLEEDEEDEEDDGGYWFADEFGGPAVGNGGVVGSRVGGGGQQREVRRRG
eukprot:g11439.t1